jgi:hypothetical protein
MSSLRPKNFRKKIKNTPVKRMRKFSWKKLPLFFATKIGKSTNRSIFFKKLPSSRLKFTFQIKSTSLRKRLTWSLHSIITHRPNSLHSIGKFVKRRAGSQLKKLVKAYKFRKSSKLTKMFRKRIESFAEKIRSRDIKNLSSKKRRKLKPLRTSRMKRLSKSIKRARAGNLGRFRLGQLHRGGYFFLKRLLGGSRNQQTFSHRLITLPHVDNNILSNSFSDFKKVFLTSSLTLVGGPFNRASYQFLEDSTFDKLSKSATSHYRGLGDKFVKRLFLKKSNFKFLKIKRPKFRRKRFRKKYKSLRSVVKLFRVFQYYMSQLSYKDYDVNHAKLLILAGLSPKLDASFSVREPMLRLSNDSADRPYLFLGSAGSTFSPSYNDLISTSVFSRLDPEFNKSRFLGKRLKKCLSRFRKNIAKVRSLPLPKHKLKIRTSTTRTTRTCTLLRRLPNLKVGRSDLQKKLHTLGHRMKKARKSKLYSRRNRNVFLSGSLDSLFPVNPLNYTSESFLSFTDPVCITSKINKPFIFRNSGLFLSSKYNFFRVMKSDMRFKFRFKKKYFSFLAPNEIKKAVLTKKKKITLSRFFYNRRRSIESYDSNFFSVKDTLFRFREFFKKEYSSATTLLGVNSQYRRSYGDVIYKDLLTRKGLDEADRYGEVLIPRVRFKPGYQRIWRLARSTLKESLRLKYAYQYRLTRYVMRFSRKINSYFTYFSELSVERIVMYAKLLPDLNTLKFFMENRWVYINGRASYKLDTIIYLNDFIQLMVSKWYYVYYRWLANWTFLRTRKFKRLVFRKSRASSYKLMKTRKQRSRYTPNWIFNVRYDLMDVRPYLEVDYFTLSAFYIYEPYLISNYPMNEFFENRQHIYRLYNWKYIT